MARTATTGQNRPTVSEPEIPPHADRLVEMLRSAYDARRGPPEGLRQIVRDYARAHRLAGSSVGTVLVELKSLVRLHTGTDEPLFTPRVVGWAVAGYFEGTSADEP